MRRSLDVPVNRIAVDLSLPTQRRLNFEMSVKNLYTSLKDRERVQKIQGLLNECMTFLQELILVVSLNINKNPEPMRS